MDGRLAAQAHTGLRTAIGVALLVAPGAMALAVGPEARRPHVKLLTRMFAVRDLTLGAGALRAVTAGEPARRWMHAGAASDAGDLVAVLLAARHLPRRRRWALLAATAAGALSGLGIAPRVA